MKRYKSKINESDERWNNLENFWNKLSHKIKWKLNKGTTGSIAGWMLESEGFDMGEYYVEIYFNVDSKTNTDQIIIMKYYDNERLDNEFSETWKFPFSDRQLSNWMKIWSDVYTKLRTEKLL